MKIITGKDNNHSLKLVLTGMITNSTVLSHIAEKWDKGLFTDKWSNLIGQWCVDYYTKYGKPPKQHIEQIYSKWAAKTKEDYAEVIGSFLGRMSNEYERSKKMNTQFVLDEARSLFSIANLKDLKDDLDDLIEEGNYKKAYEVLHKHDQIELGTGSVINVLTDDASLSSALDNPKDDILFEYDGAAGTFFGDIFSRGNFVAVEAPEKTGKSWLLMDFVFRAAEQGCRVAYFQTGDMTEKQVMRRMSSRFSKRPFKPAIIKIPTNITMSDKTPEIDYIEKEYPTYLSKKKAQKYRDRMVKKGMLEDAIKLMVYPSTTISAVGIDAQLKTLKRQGWVADVVVVDYADILAPVTGTGDDRSKINETWSRLRTISHDTLLITATQVNRGAYKADVLTKDHTADDKRKMAHVTCMIGINQKEEEKKQGVMRLNYVALREGEFLETQCVYVAGCLGIANPIMLSSF